MGIASLLFAIAEMKLLKRKIDIIPIKLYILKLMSTTAVGLTFLVLKKQTKLNLNILFVV